MLTTTYQETYIDLDKEGEKAVKAIRAMCDKYYESDADQVDMRIETLKGLVHAREEIDYLLTGIVDSGSDFCIPDDCVIPF